GVANTGCTGASLTSWGGSATVRTQGVRNTTGLTVAGTTADLAITKVATGSAVRGGSLNYTITVTNAGPNTATGVVVTDTLNGLTFNGVGPNQGTCTNPGAGNSGLVTCTLGDLANGASATI